MMPGEWWAGLRTEKQRRFVEAYLGEAAGNATAAARLAGYDEEGPALRQTAAENLTKPHIRDAIERLRATLPKRLDPATIHEIWHSLATDPDVPASTRARVLSDAARASGMYVHRVELTEPARDGAQLMIERAARAMGETPRQLAERYRMRNTVESD